MKGFSIKTEIEEYDTFEQFAKEAQLGEKDLVLCGEHTYKQYVEPLSLGVQTLFREKYGKGEPTDGAVDAILDALRDKNFDRMEQTMDNIQDRIGRIGSLVTVSDCKGGCRCSP